MRLQKPPVGFSFSQPFARRWRAVRRRSHGRPLAAVCERMENRSLLSGMPMLPGASSAEVTDLVDVSSIHGESCFSVPDDRLQDVSETDPGEDTSASADASVLPHLSVFLPEDMDRRRDRFVSDERQTRALQAFWGFMPSAQWSREAAVDPSRFRREHSVVPRATGLSLHHRIWVGKSFQKPVEADLNNGLQADDETLDEFWRELGLALKRGTPSDVFPFGELLGDPAQPAHSQDDLAPPAQRTAKQDPANTTGAWSDNGGDIQPARFEDQPVPKDSRRSTEIAPAGGRWASPKLETRNKLESPIAK